MFIVMIVVAAIVLSKTIVGRYTFSIGSNEAATALSGVNVTKWKIIIYAMSGLFVGHRRRALRVPAQLGPARRAAWASSSRRSPPS